MMMSYWSAFFQFPLSLVYYISFGLAFEGDGTQPAGRIMSPHAGELAGPCAQMEQREREKQARLEL